MQRCGSQKRHVLGPGAAIVFAVAVGCMAGCAQRNRDAQYTYELGPVFLVPGQPDSWVVKHTFRVKNPACSGPALLRVERLTCGCSSCQLDPPAIPPRGEAQITVSYTLPYERAQRREGAVVLAEAGSTSRFSLFVAADVFPRLSMVEPSAPASVRPGTEGLLRAKYVVYQPVDEPEQVLEVLSRSEGLQVLSVQAESRACRDRVRKVVWCCTARVGCPAVDDPRFGDGDFQGELEARLGRHRLVQTVHWRAARSIDVTPAQVFLRGRAADRAVFHLSSADAFCIRGWQSDSPAVEVQACEKTSSNTQDVVVRVVPCTPPSVASAASVEIQVDHPEQRCVRLPVFILW